MNTLATLASTIRDGGVLLVPTDTNYALACMPHDISACHRIYEIKRRSPDKPLTLFIDKVDTIEPYIDIDHSQRKTFEKLSKKFWPGPLNIILPSGPRAPAHKFFDKHTISVACNRNKALRQLLELCGTPLALTSANISGTDHDELITETLATELFGKEVDGIVYNPESFPETTQSSTIVKLQHESVITIRQGDIIID